MEHFDSDSGDALEARVFVEVPTPHEKEQEAENDAAMLERVNRDNERFAADVRRALQGHWPGKQIEILDFRWIEGSTDPRRYVFTVSIDGSPTEVDVDRSNVDEGSQAS